MISRIKARRGQALMELAIGMLVLAMLLSATFVFVSFIVRSLEIQNHLRGASKGTTDKIELNGFEKDMFGLDSLHIKEPVGAVDHNIP